VKDGSIVCHEASACAVAVDKRNALEFDLKGGSIYPALVSIGSNLGLQEIMLEQSTADGPVFDPLLTPFPAILGQTLVQAVDGLQFGTRDVL
jgi:hypothetical protein